MNESNVTGKFDEVLGKAKQSLGETFGNEKLANEGAADEVKGDVKQTWGNVKDTASDLHDHAVAGATVQHQEAEAHATHDTETLRDKVTSAAEHAKDSVNRGLDHLKGTDHV